MALNLVYNLHEHHIFLTCEKQSLKITELALPEF
jgi:hypothetical protein